MGEVRILSTSKVQLPAATDYPSPGSIIPLSLFDVQFIPFQPVKILFLYPSAMVSYSSIHSFKSSLALVLPHFHPLVGDVTYLPASDDVAIVCSDESGVTVIEAESDLNICNLTSDPTNNVESFFQLVPNTFREEMPVPVLTVQFTKFSGGGVAVGISLHHTAMDAWGLWKFIDCWAHTSRDGVVQSGLAPVHDRAVIMNQGKEEIRKKILNAWAPNRPKINPIAISDHKMLTRKVFTLDLTTIQILKQRAIQETTADNLSPPTTFQVIAAHTWISIARSRGITDENNKPTFMHCLIDGRTLLPSLMNPSYTGNCLFLCTVHSTGSTLMSANGFGQTCGTIAETVHTRKSEIMGSNGMKNYATNLASLSGLRVTCVGSNRLHLYGTDFGWGKPGLETFVSMSDGDVMMTAGKEKGSVQITVALKEDIDAFIHAFEGGLLEILLARKEAKL